MAAQTLDQVVALAKRRGFVYPGSEIYGGLANSWDYGPLGVELKNNIKNLWWKRFVQSRDDMVGLDAALVMNPKVWEASGHLREFVDPLVECKQCHERFRADQIPAKDERDFWRCASAQGDHVFTDPKQFNLMLKTWLGPAEEEANVVYFRPETAQAIFVDFKNVLNTSRKTLPFGIAQIGKAFRNEITPGNFIFRTREFEQMEIEYFIPVPESDDDWQAHFEYWRGQMLLWMQEIGLSKENTHELEVPADELAHYSKRTIDFEYKFPFGTKELYGLAYRTDFDLRQHEQISGENLKYKDLQTGAEFWPHVIEPSLGVDRSVLAVLIEAYDEVGEGDNRHIVLRLPVKLAPYKAAVFPLLKNKPELVAKAKTIYDDLRQDHMIAWDERGNIGKRYFSQDEIGTPYCITIDFESLDDQAVTIRDRDTMSQERVAIRDLKSFLANKLL